MLEQRRSNPQPFVNTQPTRIVSLTNVDQIMRWWSFFSEGLAYMNRETKWGEEPLDFFKVLMHAIKVGGQKALILLHIGSDAVPLGYLIAVDNSAVFGPKSALIYAVYSNKQCPSTFMELVAETTAWAKTNEYRKVQACSYRLNRTSVKLFQRYLPSRKFMVFTKDL